MKQINSFTRIAVLLVCIFILQGLFWGLPSLVITAAGQQTCNCSDPACASPTCPPPNIILIVADDLGWGDLCANSTSGTGCNSNTYSYYCYRDSNIRGNCTNDSECDASNYLIKPGCYRSNTNTPHLDILAQKGVRLTNYYTPTPVCSPARASLMTGKHPFRHGDTNNQVAASIRGTEKTLAKALKENVTVYNTGVVGKWHLGWPDYSDPKRDETVTPTNQGFDYSYVIPAGVYDDMYGFCFVEDWKNRGNADREYKFYTSTAIMGKNESRSMMTKSCPNSAQTGFPPSDGLSVTQMMTERALAFIKKATPNYETSNNSGAPFFLYLAYTAPHMPLDLHLSSDSRNESLTITDPTEREKFKYRRVVSELSREIGRILAEIDSTGNMKDNTIVIFTSDNGPWLGSDLNDSTKDHASTGGLKGGKQFTFEGGIRVPFIARWPRGYSSGIVSKQPADHMDIFTTLLSAVYASNGKTPSLPVTIDGKNLAPVLSADKKVDKTIHSYSPFANNYVYGCPTNQTCTSSPNAIQAFFDPSGAESAKSSLNYYKLFLFPEHFKKDPVTGQNVSNDTPLAFPNDPYSSQGLYQIGKYLCNMSYPDKTCNKDDDCTNNHALKGCYSINADDEENVIVDSTKITALMTEASTFRSKAINSYNTTAFKYYYYFPSINDDDSKFWANYIDVRAKEAKLMDAKFTVYDMNGLKKGEYIYSNTDPDADEPSVAPNSKAAQRPSWIVGSDTSPVPIEGSVIVETNIPAIASTNTIANKYKGFDIYEAAKPRAVHTFSKNYDGPTYYQCYILIQNIYNKPTNVTIKLSSGQSRTVDIQPYGTYKVRPSEIAGGIDFNGSVVVYSNLNAPEDGLGPPIPAMDRYEIGPEAITIYESSDPQGSPLAFPHIRDGKFGGTLDYQNFLSIFNPGANPANIKIQLYKNSGGNPLKTFTYTVAGKTKATWRPLWILYSNFNETTQKYELSSYCNGKNPPDDPQDTCGIDAYNSFEGAIVVSSDIPVIGQTNVLYPGSTNTYKVDAFAIYDSATLASTLYFPKIFDNRNSDGHLTANYVYIQNPEQTPKTILIEQFNGDGTLNGTKTVDLPSYATHVYRPYTLVTDGTSTLRGSVKVTETNGLKIAGVVRYEIHQIMDATSKIDGMTVYRAMGQ